MQEFKSEVAIGMEDMQPPLPTVQQEGDKRLGRCITCTYIHLRWERLSSSRDAMRTSNHVESTVPHESCKC